MAEFGFQWHITNLCNLRCRHCYQNDFTDNDDLDTEINRRIVNIISENLSDRQISINITGGEPLLRQDIFAILDCLDEIGNVREYNIITNALPLNEKKVKRLETCTKLKQIKISLECSDSALNDSIRGKGSFKKIMSNFERLKEFSTKQKVLMFTLGSYNYKHLLVHPHLNPPPSRGREGWGGMLAFSEKAGADAVIIERFVPLGQGIELKEHFLKKEEWLRVVEDIIEFCDLNIAPEELLPYKAFYIELRQGHHREVHGALCNLGEESMALMPNGDIFPCRRTPVKIGNILSDDFNDILIRLKLLRESFNQNLKGSCNNCSVLECIGCRALSYALTGDLYEADRQCYLNK